MKIKRILRDEKGAVLPLVALFLFFVALGVAALVIDVGMMYSERRSMVTAADAGALAGAKDLNSVDDLKFIIRISREVAIKNGADDSGLSDIAINNLIVLSGSDNAKLDDGKIKIEVDRRNVNKYNRPYVEVTSTKNTQHYFARIFGETNSDVRAAAVASYNKISFQEFVFPIGAIYSDFYDSNDQMKTNVPVYFHDRKPLLGKTNWSGLLDINPKMGEGKTEIVDIVKERQIFPVADFLEPIADEENELEIDYYVDVAGGWKNFKDAAQTLINESADLSFSERKDYLTGYIPVLKEVNSLAPQDENVPIIVLAEFVLVDYAEKSGNKGQWLTKNYGYTIVDGIISVNYENIINNKTASPHDDGDTIMGYFTGKTITAINAYSSEVKVFLFK